MFVGRECEIEQLRAMRLSKAATLSVVYGRRRVGKSALIREAYKGEHALYFEGLEGLSKSKQIANFLFQLAQQTPNGSICHDVKSWSEALIQLKPILKNKPTVVVFDEFQWMANYRDDLVSEFKMLWDMHFSKIPGTGVVLCGSIASFMISKVIKSKALYGRVELELNLQPFRLVDASRMLKGRGETEVVESMLLLGGVPLYLKMLKKSSSLYLGVNELAFRRNSYFLTEFDKIFVSHFGRVGNYERIVRALSKSSYGLFRDQIADVCRVPLSGNLSTELFNLEVAGFIKSYTPVDKEPSSKIKKFVLSDPYLKFYFQFIETNRKSVLQDQVDIFLRITQTPAYYRYLGIAFEQFCQNHSHVISRILGFSGIEYSVGPYFRKTTHEQGVQIDLLFDRSDNVITLCEMKYSRNPIGVDVIKDVEKKVQVLQAVSKKTIQKVLIVKHDVTKEIERSGYFFKILRISDFFT